VQLKKFTNITTAVQEISIFCEDVDIKPDFTLFSTEVGLAQYLNQEKVDGQCYELGMFDVLYISDVDKLV